MCGLSALYVIRLCHALIVHYILHDNCVYIHLLHLLYEETVGRVCFVSHFDYFQTMASAWK